MASSLFETLTSSGGTESAGFLNKIVEQLWPNINVAGCRMVKEIVEPILASTLPGPLSALRFVKLDLGNVPMKVGDVEVHKTSTGGIKLDMNVTWESVSDIELDAKMCPKIGIERVHLRGRLSVLLGPLTNVIPLIGAAQVAFINPPELTLDFTDAADIADCFLISKIVRKTIIEIVGGMAVLPNRFLVKLDNANDFFKTYVPYHGVLRVTVEKATGVTGPKKNGAKGLLAKIVKDVPDCYCKVKVGTTTEWRTTTKKNNYEPAWNETHDFLVSDYEQAIELNVQDDDIGGDDDVGVGSISVKDILLGGGTKEIALTHNGEHTDGRLTVHAKFLNLVNNTSSLDEGAEDDQFVGLATVLVASALNLQGQHEELRPSVKVSWAGKNFRTAILKYAPGSDIFNPAFDQAFTIPITKSMVENPEQFKIALLDKEEETGSAEVPFEQVRNAEYATVAEAYDVGSGSSVRVSISLRGLEFAE